MKVWLDVVAGTKVERVPVSYLGSTEVPTSVPRKAVMHTTEGSFESALSEFKTKYAPTFLVGYDKNGTFRIVQFAPIGVMTHALENPAGGVETNRWAMAQVETAAYSSTVADPRMSPSKAPMSAEFRTKLAVLMDEIRKVAGVPLQKGGNGTRNVTNWKTKPGWYGHSEVPENSHWDPGELDRQAHHRGGVHGRRRAHGHTARRRGRCSHPAAGGGRRGTYPNW